MAKTYDMDGSESRSIPERQEKKKKEMARLMRVTELDQKYNTPAYQRFMKGDPSYFFKELKKSKKGKV
tara:strand:- start:57 stop:260 length:204 start_codon:yes stop_codon:yes gene_type:complete